jgi:hypothetical protein
MQAFESCLEASKKYTVNPNISIWPWLVPVTHASTDFGQSAHLHDWWKIMHSNFSRF